MRLNQQLFFSYLLGGSLKGGVKYKKHFFCAEMTLFKSDHPENYNDTLSVPYLVLLNSFKQTTDMYEGGFTYFYHAAVIHPTQTTTLVISFGLGVGMWVKEFQKFMYVYDEDGLPIEENCEILYTSEQDDITY